jgi:hypothetical protein
LGLKRPEAIEALAVWGRTLQNQILRISLNSKSCSEV